MNAIADELDARVESGELAQLVLAQRHARTVVCRDGRIADATESRTSSGRLAVWRDEPASPTKRMGVAAGPCNDPADVAALLATARAMAHVEAPPPRAADEPSPARALTTDSRVFGATPADVIAVVRRLLAQLQDASATLVAETLSLSAESSHSVRKLAGAAAEVGAGTRLAWAISLAKRVGAAATSLVEISGCDTHWERGTARLARELGSVARRLTATTGLTALDCAGPHRMLLTPTAVADLVLPYLTFQLAAGSQLSGLSRLTIGAPAALPALWTLRDEPHAPESFRACVRDRDGTATRAQLLIDHGAVVAPIAGRQHAALLGIAAPGLAGGPFGLALDAGDLDEEQLARTLGPVLHLGTFAGDFDGPSGRFAGVAKACWIESALGSTFIEDFSIAGNLHELLASAAHLGRRREWVRGEALCPSLLVERGVEYGAAAGR